MDGIILQNNGGFVKDTSITANGLNPGTNYTIEVRTIDSVAGEYSIPGTYQRLTCKLKLRAVMLNIL